MRSRLSAALLVCISALGASARAAPADPSEDADARWVEGGEQLHDAGQEDAETKPLDVVFEGPASSAATTPTERPTQPPAGEERTWTGARIGLTAALATVGVTGIVVGALSSAAAVNADDRIQAANTKLGPAAACRGTPLPSACVDLSSARRDHSSALVGSYLGYGLGVLGLGTAIASTLYWYTAPVRVVPTGSAQSGGVVVMGSF